MQQITDRVYIFAKSTNFMLNYTQILSVSYLSSSALCYTKMWTTKVQNKVRGHSRSLEMAPFDRLHRSSYSSSIVTMAVSCTVFEIKRSIARKRQLLRIFAQHFNTKCPSPWALLGGAKILPKSSRLCLGCSNVTGRQTDGSCHWGIYSTRALWGIIGSCHKPNVT